MKITDKPLCDLFFAYMDKAIGYVKGGQKQEFIKLVEFTVKNGLSMCQLLKEKPHDNRTRAVGEEPSNGC